jgi:uncharacterized protein (TIRG00374 family)
LISKSFFKTVIRYVLILAVMGVLLWLSLRGIKTAPGEDKLDYLLNAWGKADKLWLFIMAIVAILSHVVRAERWRLLVKSSGHQVSLGNSFLSLLVGYLVNLVIPRGGEVSRCYNLYKLEGAPVETSFGTVVVERIVDMLCLLLLIGISFLVESHKLMAFIDTLPIGTEGSSFLIFAYMAIAGILSAAALLLLYKKHEGFRNFVKKIGKGFRDGLLSIFNLKNKTAFTIHSILIWFLYFLMSYTVLQAFESTNQLGWDAVLSLFAIGAIAMAAPLPGGTGSYHVLVPQGLIYLYAVKDSDAVAFTFIFHGWQTLIMIVGGCLAILVTAIKTKNSKIDSKIKK